jgi:hypothetical protein
VLALVVRQSLLLILTGTVIGLSASFALTRLLSSLLFGVSAHGLANLRGGFAASRRRSHARQLHPGASSDEGGSNGGATPGVINSCNNSAT